MVWPIVLFAVGLLLLIKGGDWFVDGAVGTAHRFRVPELLIGATVVSIGTTLPEVMVSAGSAVSGHPEIAYGNAIGSVICNTALIAALTLAIRPGKATRNTLKLPVAFFFIAAAFYAGISYTTGRFSRFSGILLLVLFVTYMTLTVLQMKKSTAPALEAAEEQTNEAPEKERKLWLNIVLLVIGAAAIAFGADLLVDNGTKIAEMLGVPESVIALTFVALGTSLPELITAITSLVKGYSSLSLGNIIGANLFNLVLVSGLSITLKPFDVPQSSVFLGHQASLVLDIPLMFTVMLILTVPALWKEKLHRWQGILLLALYAGFCAIQFTM